MNSEINIYIPRVLGSLTEKEIKEHFHYLNVGKVVYIDMYRKTNENGYPYYFAFITLELYNSSIADVMIQQLERKSIMHLVYDEENNQYWEVKKHIPKEERNKKNSIINTITSFYNDVEKERLLNEYEELEKELFAFVC